MNCVYGELGRLTFLPGNEFFFFLSFSMKERSHVTGVRRAKKNAINIDKTCTYITVEKRDTSLSRIFSKKFSKKHIIKKELKNIFRYFKNLLYLFFFFMIFNAAQLFAKPRDSS